MWENQFHVLTPGDTSRIVVPAEHQRMSNLVAYVDGGSLGNPGPSGIGVVIDGCENGTIRIQKWIGHQDNNVAEYIALLEALHYAVKLSASALHVFSDSEVVVRQMSGEYTCRSPQLYSLNWICRKLARSNCAARVRIFIFYSVSISCIRPSSETSGMTNLNMYEFHKNYARLRDLKNCSACSCTAIISVESDSSAASSWLYRSMSRTPLIADSSSAARSLGFIASSS